MASSINLFAKKITAAQAEICLCVFCLTLCLLANKRVITVRIGCQKSSGRRTRKKSSKSKWIDVKGITVVSQFAAALVVVDPRIKQNKKSNKEFGHLL